MGLWCPWNSKSYLTTQYCIYYCGLHLCLRGGDEHRSLKLSQFVVKTVENPSATNKTIKCLTYNEHGSKNRPGSTHQVYLSNKEVIHYANSSLGENCFVHISELNVSKLPSKAIEKDRFY